VQSIKTKYGIIHVSDPGPYQKYPNINLYKQTKTRNIVLQGPAIRAFKAAEERVAKPGKKHILITGEGYRDYWLQRSLWLSDPGRYANPDSSMHTEGLAVDVDQNQGSGRLANIKKALVAEGWHQSVAGEPWHFSFKVVG
jgi:hypothetical protein